MILNVPHWEITRYDDQLDGMSRNEVRHTVTRAKTNGAQHETEEVRELATSSLARLHQSPEITGETNQFHL